MLTEEQIKNLKEGDSLQLDVVFSADVDHEILIKVPTTHGHWVSQVFSPVILSLPPAEPKYNPCRKFKKGDKVRIVHYKGRDYNHKAKLSRGKEAKVLYDEAENMLISIKFPGKASILIDPAYLELVTPVEELEPYRVEKDQHGYHIENNDGQWLVTYCNEFHPNAYQAAINERDRLNAEYRKEQQ